jgi:hypothetical protein
MLFKQRFWKGLANGTVTVTFRRWKRPQAVVGRRYRTPAGLIEVDAVERVEAAGISERDVRRAGYRDRSKLLADLDRYGSGKPVYRIGFHFAGADPREELRRSDELAGDELAELTARLARLDRAGPRGPWTSTILRLIGERPGVRAAELAASMGRDRASFKLDVRRLKELGLTESLEVGYRLSPRGRALLTRFYRR